MTYKRIRELREDHDLTQKYMAHYLNVIQRTYSRYERAVGTSKTIRSLARLAGAVMRQPGRVDTSIMNRSYTDNGDIGSVTQSQSHGNQFLRTHSLRNFRACW